MISKNTIHKYSLAASIAFIFLLSIFGRRLQAAVTEIIDARWIGWGILVFLLVVLIGVYRNGKGLNISRTVLISALLVLAGGALALFTGFL